MGDYRHILLAVDFGSETDAIARRALDLAQRYGARLSLIHVVDYLPPAYAGDQMLPGYVGDLAMPEGADIERKLIERAEAQLEDLARRLGVEEASRWVELGSAREGIVRMAEDNQVDLIVVGSHGRHGLALLLGSTANGVLHHAKCDVLAVRVGSQASS